MRFIAAAFIRRVGMIRLGKMDNPLCRHLRNTGFEVIGTDFSEAVRRNGSRKTLNKMDMQREARGTVPA